MNVYKSMEQLIGNTPLLELCKAEEQFQCAAKLYAKLEGFNPTGSVKDRAAQGMLNAAERKGLLQKGGVVIEPTSGNTGIGLALLCKARGYRLIIVMPDSMSIERRKLIEAYGAQIVLTDGKKGMTGAIEKAKELQQSMPNAYIPDQFSNPANAEAHYLSTGPEIYEALEGKVDVFVAGIGTGGTVTGVGKYLKEKNPNVKIVGVEPSSSPVLTKGISGSHGIQGIGAGFVPKVLDRNILNEVLTVTDEESVTSAKYLSREEGVSAGISSGAAFKAALEIAKRKENENKNVVVLLPDTGAKYLSTALYGD